MIKSLNIDLSKNMLGKTIATYGYFKLESEEQQWGYLTLNVHIAMERIYI